MPVPSHLVHQGEITVDRGRLVKMDIISFPSGILSILLTCCPNPSPTCWHPRPPTRWTTPIQSTRFSSCPSCSWSSPPFLRYFFPTKYHHTPLSWSLVPHSLSLLSMGWLWLSVPQQASSCLICIRNHQEPWKGSGCHLYDRRQQNLQPSWSLPSTPCHLAYGPCWAP